VPQTWEEVEGAQSGHLPGLGAQLAGVQAGDKKAVDIVFPADFTAVLPLAGKTARYEVEIQEVRERILPEMNEEFFKSNQVANLESCAPKSSAISRCKRSTPTRWRPAARSPRRSPPWSTSRPRRAWWKRRPRGVLRQFIEENMRRGVPAEQFEKGQEEPLRRRPANGGKAVKIQLILAKVAEAEKIEVGERDLDNFIYREAQRSNQRPEKLAKDLSKDRSRLRSIQGIHHFSTRRLISWYPRLR